MRVTISVDLRIVHAAELRGKNRHDYVFSVGASDCFLKNCKGVLNVVPDERASSLNK